MTDLIFLTTNVVLGGLVLFVLIMNQMDRKKGIEREMRLIKAIIAQNTSELMASQESPKDTQKRMKLENDLAEKAQKILEAEGGNESDRVRVQ